MAFKEWLNKVDNVIEIKYGLTTADLPDCNYYDMFEDGYTPSRAANVAIKNAHDW